MPLSNAEKQKRFRDKLSRDKKAEKLAKENAARKKKRSLMSHAQLKSVREAERRRQGKRREQLATNTSSPKYSRQSIGKAVKSVKGLLPKSPRKRSRVVCELARQYGTSDRERKDHNDRIKHSEDIRAFYCRDDVSWQSPNRKDFVIVRKDGDKIYIQKRYMVMTLSECHALYNEQHPNGKVSLSMFCSLRPEQVCLVREFPHNVCLCKYHKNVRLLLDCLKNTVKSVTISTNFREFVGTIVCDQESESCMLGKCDGCQTRFEETYAFQDVEAEVPAAWYQWVNVEGRATKQKEEGTIQDCSEVLKAQLPAFLVHTFVKRKQSAHFEQEKAKASREHVVIQVDFAENFAIIQQDEIQSAHWAHSQVTLFTACANFDANTVQSYVMVSDDLVHGKFAVATFLDKIINDVMIQCPNLKSLSFFSDGAASQFKQRYLFDNITHFRETYGVQTSWNFFATSHGKGVVDGIGGQVKRLVWTAMRTGAYVHDGESFAEVAAAKAKAIKVIFVPSQQVEDAKEALDNRWADVSPLPTTHTTHIVIAVRKHVLCHAMYAGRGEYHVSSLKSDVELTDSDHAFARAYVNGEERDNSDVLNGDKLPTSSDHSEITPQSIKLGDFVLVEYMGAKKTSGRYAYVAQVQEEHVDDGVVEFCVTHLHKYDSKGFIFVAKDRTDKHGWVAISQITRKLPSPTMDNRERYHFQDPILEAN